MLNSIKRQLRLYGLFNNSINSKRDFSVFNKLKDFLKSGAQNQVSFYGSNIDPDKIKVEIDEDMSTRKNKLKGTSNIQLSEEEAKLIQQLPKQIMKYERNITLVEQESKERALIDSMISEIQNDEATEQIKKTLRSKYKTIWEKMDHYETTADGKIKLPYVYEEDGKTQKIYETMKEYLEWKEKKVVELKEKIFEKLTPMEYYITQGKGSERPYTGIYWDTEKVGVYCCKVCTQRVFSSTHKYQAKGVGHATFWNFLPFTLNFYEDNLNYPQPTQAVYKLQFAKSVPKKRATCSNCDAHLGHVFDDGPAPFFKRLNINSAAIQFIDIGWYESPDEIKRVKELAVLMEEQDRIEKEKTKIQTLKKEVPKVFEYIDKHIVDSEKSITYDKIALNFKYNVEKEKSNDK